MNECKIAGLFEGSSYLFSIGFGLAATWVAIYFLIWAGTRLWAWVDDAKTKVNVIDRMIGKLRGYKYKGMENGHSWNFYKGDDQRTDLFVGTTILIIPLTLLLAPFAIVKLYALVLFVVTMYIMANLARFARRHKKLFDKHVKDPEAHKE